MILSDSFLIDPVETRLRVVFVEVVEVEVSKGGLNCLRAVAVDIVVVDERV